MSKFKQSSSPVHQLQLEGQAQGQVENEKENEKEKEGDKRRKEQFLKHASVACKEGRVTVSRRHPSHPNKHKEHQFQLAYRLFRPSLLHHDAAPVVVLHGGPGLPSDYLHPLVDVLPRRTILFHDQLGCGGSDSPTDLAHYSIADSVNDLSVLLASLSISRFHLYGHSYGGILVYEYLKHTLEHQHQHLQPPQGQCLSAILSSTPSSIEMSDRHSVQLEQSLRQRDTDDDLTLHRRFRHRHLCRVGTSDDTDDLPPPLRHAFDRLGKVWCGTAVVKDYVASASTTTTAAGSRRGGTMTMPPALLLRGEFDFVEERCGLDGWRCIWKDCSKDATVSTVTLEGCSHMALLENGGLYGNTLESFLSNLD